MSTGDDSGLERFLIPQPDDEFDGQGFPNFMEWDADSCDEQPKTARDTALTLTETLEAILSFLPMEDIYRARRVCTIWGHCVYNSPTLQQLLYFQTPRYQPDRVHYNELWTTPCTLNPLLKRTILLPKEGCFTDRAALAPIDPSTTTQKDSLYENLLQTDPPAEKSKAPPMLSGLDKRPTIDVAYKTKITLGPKIPESYSNPKEGQVAWKGMLVSDTPIHSFKLRCVGETCLIIGRRYSGSLIMFDLLSALQDLKAWSEGWPKNTAPNKVYEFEILLPFQQENGEDAPSLVDGDGIWRALKTRIKCRIGVDLRESGQEEEDERQVLLRLKDFIISAASI